MATQTTKLGLDKPATTDLVDIAVLNTNFDDIDAAAGATICTSATRPVSPWNGQIIFETDTLGGFVWRSATSSWTSLGGSTVSSDPPTTAANGDLWWDSDNGKLYIYYVDANSSQWVSAVPSTANVPVVANAAGRDALFTSPYQGAQVFRNDIGSLETYYGLYNISTNPGGRDVAGWYADSRQDGLVPIRPTTVTVVTGSGSANALGQVSFTGASSVSFDGVFTSKYKNYRLVMGFNSMTTASVSPGFRVRNAGVDFSASNYHRMAQSVTDVGASAASFNANSSNITLFTAGNGLNLGATTLDIINPNVSGIRKAIQFSSTGFNGTAITGWFGAGAINNTSTYDGFTIFMQGGNCSGVISIYGYGE